MINGLLYFYKGLATVEGSGGAVDTTDVPGNIYSTAFFIF